MFYVCPPKERREQECGTSTDEHMDDPELHELRRSSLEGFVHEDGADGCGVDAA